MAASSVAMDESSSPKHFNHQNVDCRVAVYPAGWLLEGPEPPSLFRDMLHSLRHRISSCRNNLLSPPPFFSVLQHIFPILLWGRSYSVSKFKNDLMAGLTIASLCIPQSIGYANLARLDPQYGLYTSVVPPLVYAVMGSSRDIAVGPVAVVSLLLPSMIQKIVDPAADPGAYKNLVLTATFFSGVFQASFGIFRLGFLVDLLSHATITGFMAGAAVVIGFQQLKTLLGISGHFSEKSDVVSVIKALCKSLEKYNLSPLNFIIGFSFLCFILLARFVGKRKKKLMWVGGMGPLIAVVVATVGVYLTRGDKHGVKIVRHIQGGFNPSSVHQLQLSGPLVGPIAKVGLVVALVALTEAIAVGRSFAAIKGYKIDGNREMVAMGLMNIIGSCTSCYVATGSFSRSAVNLGAGCETAVSNIVMGVTVMLTLQLMTKLLYYTPTPILASVILSALPGLVDLPALLRIWKLDKLDFLASLAAFFGLVFASVETGLLVALAVSFLKIILISIRPATETLGIIPATHVFCDLKQYPMAIHIPGILIVRLNSSLLCFANATFVRERITRLVISEDINVNATTTTQLLILDMSNLMDVDTSGIASLEELRKSLATHGIEIAIANPRWQVIHKLKLSNFVGEIEERVFLTIEEAVNAKSSIGANKSP